ncbi:hypothetical protein ACIBEJ_48650 [Nonomuraea sp. NPDC050790]|uniref:hypothetical protein n=1 Tax=Nonomuraea sp. NPDC050790 TaxID=3364371 RepID=UPI0037BC6824
MALQDGIFSDTWIKALSNDIALDMGDTTPGVFKGALYTGAVAGGTINFDQSNPAYNSSPFDANQSSGPGYSAGGLDITVISLATLAGDARRIGWKVDPLSWTGTTITAEGLLIYIPGLSNRALGYRWFGQPYPTSDGDFDVNFHTDGALRQMLRAAA